MGRRLVLRALVVGPGILAVAATIWLASALHTPSAAGAGDCTTNPALDSEEQAFLTLINNYRSQNALGPLAASFTLSKASQWKSTDMGNNAYFAHDDLSRTWVDRIRDCGYGYNAWLGENIAAGISTAQEAFNLWKGSPGHNANMLNSNYTAIGIGRAYVAGSPWGWYWTTDFGSFSDGWPNATPTAAPSSTATPTRTSTPTNTAVPTATSTPTPDTTAPNAAITSPLNNATVSGGITITASAADSQGLQKVRFWVDGAYLGYDTATPYTMPWDSTTSSNGAHTIRVDAIDWANNTTSATVAVTVAN